MAIIPLFVLLFRFSFVSSTDDTSSASSSTGVVGVTYFMNTRGLPPSKKVADALVAAGVTRVLLMDPYPDGVASFNETRLRITIAVNNSYLPMLAKNESEALRWIGDNIILPNITVEAISVGYDVLTDHLDLADYLLPALRNLRAAMSAIGFDTIDISTSSSYDLITPSFPPSAAHFNSSVVHYVEPLLAFLADANSSFLIQLFPFKLYRSGAVPGANTGFAAFEGSRDGNSLTDPKTGLSYQNLFDAMVDATVEAMDKLGYADIPLVVSGTGWPSGGGRDVPEASILFAAEYNEGLVNKMNMRLGTPARPAMTPVTYIFSLFDDPLNDGVASDKNWGIWTVDMQEKYAIDFTPGDNGAPQPRLLPGWTFLSAAGWVAACVAAFWFAV